MNKYILSIVTSIVMFLPSAGRAQMQTHGTGKDMAIELNVDELLLDLPAAIITTFVKNDPKLAAKFMEDPVSFSARVAEVFPNVNLERAWRMDGEWDWRVPYREDETLYCGNDLPSAIEKKEFLEHMRYLKMLRLIYGPPKPPGPPQRSEFLLMELAAGDEIFLSHVVATCQGRTHAVSPYAERASGPIENIKLPLFALQRLRDFVLIGAMAAGADLFNDAWSESISIATLQEYGFTEQDALGLDQRKYVEASLNFLSPPDELSGSLETWLRLWLSNRDFTDMPYIFPGRMSVTLDGAKFPASEERWNFYPWTEYISQEDLMDMDLNGDDLEQYFNNLQWSEKYSWTLNGAASASLSTTGHTGLDVTMGGFIHNVECFRKVGESEYPFTCLIDGLAENRAMIWIPFQSPLSPDEDSDIRVIVWIDEGGGCLDRRTHYPYPW